MDCCSMFRRRSQHAVEGDDGAHSVKVFSYNELRKATQDFSGANKIGEGGFGSVFRGMLKDGTLVAVKVLSATSRQGVVRMLTGSKNVSMEKITRPAMITDFTELKVSGKPPEGANETHSNTSRSFTTTEATEPLFSSSETPTQLSI